MKKNKWNQLTALSYLHNQGYESPHIKCLFKKGGAKGLKECSAIDYLVNYEKYTVILLA